MSVLDDILSRADELRAIGVTRVRCGDTEVEFSPSPVGSHSRYDAGAPLFPAMPPKEAAAAAAQLDEAILYAAAEGGD